MNKQFVFSVIKENLTFLRSHFITILPMLSPKSILLIAFLSLLYLSSCSSIEVFKENTEIPLSKPYQSFVIVNKELNIKGFEENFIDEMVRIELQNQLEAAGMVYDAKRPDVVIRYNSNEDPRKKETVNYANPYPFWGYRVYDPWFFNPYSMQNMNRISVSNYELLQVIVDFIDPIQDKYLMTLTAVTEVSNPKSKQKKVIKSLNSATQVFLNSNPINPK
ncbi:hypothetical protein Aoki45_06200 [Algoriphagus sp. oki45]|nr:hypothetical protein Aoki45_06200 [Algoriphagus sp. oki45]